MRTFTVVPSFEGESAYFELPDIGFQGDHLSFAILFNLTELTEHWPNILPSMIVTDAQGNTFIAPNTSWDQAKHIFTWNISSTETAHEGNLLCQLKCTAADDPRTIVCMSRICQTRVYSSLAAADDPPEAFQSWLDTLAQLGAEIQADAAAVLESVETTETNARSAQSAADDAEAARDAAIVTKNAVDQSVQSAIDAKDAAVQAQQRAQQSATNATAAMEAAGQAQALAEQALEEADTAVSTARTSASSASDSATQAATSMATANTAKLGAEAARDAAVVAKGAAETAQQRAETAEEGAAAAKTAAVAAQTAAETAQTAAETAKASVDSSKAAIETMHDEMADYREGIEDYAELSRKWAEGKSFSGDAVPTDDETYHNNSKYWANIAATEASTVQGYGLYVDEEGNGRIRSTTDPGVDISEPATKADIIINSATGAIASFTDGADDLPVRDLTVQIEPVQDLNGYANPWPAGSGKNKLPSIAEITATQNGITFVCDGEGSCSFSGTATAQAWFSYTIPAVTLSENVYVHLFNSNGYDDNRPIIDFYYDDVRVDFVGFTVADRIYNGTSAMAGESINKLQLRVPAGFSGTCAFKLYISETADIENFSPYSNICPITGWTGAKVTRTGKNLLDFADVTDYLNWSDQVAPSGDMSSNGSNRIFSLPKLNAGRQYTISFGISIEQFPTYLYFGYHKNGSGTRLTYVTTGTVGVSHYTFTALEDVTYCLRMGSTGTKTNFDTQIAKLSYIQLELGSTATAYEPYQGNTYDITFPSEAGTVYGGSLDVTTGVLTVDRAMVDMGTLTFAKSSVASSVSGNVFQIPLSTIGIATRERYAPNTMLSSVFATAPDDRWYIVYMLDNEVFSNPTNVYFSASRYDTAEDFRAAMNGVQLCYKLATPQTYQLTPQEVKTLLGQNNIFSDTGDSTVTYPADTKLYIDGKIAAALGG